MSGSWICLSFYSFFPIYPSADVRWLFKRIVHNVFQTDAFGPPIWPIRICFCQPPSSSANSFKVLVELEIYRIWRAALLMKQDSRNGYNFFYTTILYGEGGEMKNLTLCQTKHKQIQDAATYI